MLLRVYIVINKVFSITIELVHSIVSSVEIVPAFYCFVQNECQLL